MFTICPPSVLFFGSKTAIRTTDGGRMVENHDCLRFARHLLFGFARQQRFEQHRAGELWKTTAGRRTIETYSRSLISCRPGGSGVTAIHLGAHRQGAARPMGVIGSPRQGEARGGRRQLPCPVRFPTMLRSRCASHQSSRRAHHNSTDA